jgi:hypothetical protein
MTELRLAVMCVEAALPSEESFFELSMLAIVVGGCSHGGFELDWVIQSLCLSSSFYECVCNPMFAAVALLLYVLCCSNVCGVKSGRNNPLVSAPKSFEKRQARLDVRKYATKL